MNYSVLKLTLSMALLSAAVAARAGSEVGQLTIGGGGMWTQTDTGRGLGGDYGFYGELGYALNQHWDVALNGFSGRHDIKGSGATGSRRINARTVRYSLHPCAGKAGNSR